MKDHEVVARLRDLRQLRERRAKEEVIRRQAAEQKARAETETASGAVEEHLRQVAADEQSTFSLLPGGPMTAQDLHRIQLRFEKNAESLARLRATLQDAKSNEAECRKDVLQARDKHRVLFKAVARLDNALEKLVSRDAVRSAARDEAATEEQFVLARPEADIANTLI